MLQKSEVTKFIDLTASVESLEQIYKNLPMVSSGISSSDSEILDSELSRPGLEPSVRRHSMANLAFHVFFPGFYFSVLSIFYGNLKPSITALNLCK